MSGPTPTVVPEDLEQFAVMGKIFMEQIMGLPNPSIGLMSIGEEETKGNDLTKQAFERLQASSLNFIGNVEGKDFYSGKADIIVSDGFTGNVALKVSEGVVETLFHMARREIMKDFFAKIGFLLMKRHLKKIYKKVDYSEYGGAQLLGLNGVCIIGHGRSNPERREKRGPAGPGFRRQPRPGKNPRGNRQSGADRRRGGSLNDFSG